MSESPPSVDELRDALIESLKDLRAIRTEAVAEAVRAVPRHLFIPEVPLASAYEPEEAVITKSDEDGVAISSVSAARIQAFMLEQAEIRPGMRVLEIGSGGYNAALIAELVGEDGEVTTVDIDPEVTNRARRLLDGAGYRHVNVARVDGEEGAPAYALYDRIIVTVGAWDIPPAWTEQLAEGGRLVVPLRMRGLTRSVAFDREDGRLVGRDYELCGFVPMQGAGERRQHLALLHGKDVGLRLDDDQQVNTERLSAALARPRAEVWSGVTAGKGERFDGLHLWLAVKLPDFGLLAATKEAVEQGRVSHSSPLGIPTAVGEGSFAYLTMRPTTPERESFEFGAYGHGPDAKKLAEQVVEHIESWDGTSLNAHIEAHPVGTPDEQLPAAELVLDKRHTRVTVSWP